jgi:hypothetical protein
VQAEEVSIVLDRLARMLLLLLRASFLPGAAKSNLLPKKSNNIFFRKEWNTSLL